MVFKELIIQFYSVWLMLLLSAKYHHHHQRALLPILPIEITPKVEHQKNYVFFKLTFKIEVHNALVRT